MHVVFIDSIPNPGRPGQGGLSDITWRLGMELAQTGARVDIIGPYATGVVVPETHHNLVVYSVPEAIVTRPNLATHLLSTYRLARVAKNLTTSNTVFHANNSVTVASLCAFGQAKRVVWHGHMNVNVYTYNGEKNPWDRSMFLLMRASTYFASRSGTAMVALGPSVKKWWELSGFKSDNIFVIPNGIDLVPNEPKNSLLSLPPQWREFKYHIAYVGRLSAEKGGYRELVEAVAELNREGLPVFLVMIGDGPERDAILRQIELLECSSCVKIAGLLPRTTVDQLVQLVDLVVLPSKGEMMPRVMLEAWAAGTPFMATAVGAIPDYLIDNHNGYLVKDLSVESLMTRIRDALLDDEMRYKIGERGRETAATLSWQHTAEMFLNVYEKVLAGQ